VITLRSTHSTGSEEGKNRVCVLLKVNGAGPACYGQDEKKGRDAAGNKADLKYRGYVTNSSPGQPETTDLAVISNGVLT